MRCQTKRNVRPGRKTYLSVVGFAASALALMFVQATAAQAASTWGLLLPLHLATTNVPGQITSINAISCSSVGNCGAGGAYSTKSGEQAFVVSEKRGTWGTAEAIPGVSALDIGGSAAVTSISCGSSGDCTAVGTYADSSYDQQAFVANETNGTWGTAIELPGLAALGQVGSSAVSNISCGSFGNCSLGFVINVSSGSAIYGVATETNGTWGNGVALPGFAALPSIGGFGSYDISCSSPGNCGASGTFDNGSGSQGFVDNEIEGVWGSVAAVPGLSQSDVLGKAAFDSISCSAPGDCSAGGSYAATENASGSTYYPEAFVVSEVNGVWGDAIEVPGTAALNAGGDATVSAISCSSPGDCDAVGIANSGKQLQATFGKGLADSFSSTETDGLWKKAIELFSGTTTAFVSCRTAGNCEAATSNLNAVLTKSESNGVWGPGATMFGPLSSNVMPNVNLGALSCASDGSCGAGGNFGLLTTNENEAFVLNSSASGSGKTTVPGAPRIAVTSPMKGILDVAIVGTANSGGRPITDYEATMSVSGEVVEEETWTNPYGNILPLDGLTPGTYSVRLRIKNALGWGPLSSAHAVTIK